MTPRSPVAPRWHKSKKWRYRHFDWDSYALTCNNKEIGGLSSVTLEIGAYIAPCRNRVSPEYPYPKETGGAWVAQFLVWAPGILINWNPHKNYSKGNGTVDAPLTDPIWQFRWYFSYLFELVIWLFIFQKYCFYAIYKLYYENVTNVSLLCFLKNALAQFYFIAKLANSIESDLKIINELSEKLWICMYFCILKPKALFTVHVLLFACTIKWKFQDSFSIT